MGLTSAVALLLGSLVGAATTSAIVAMPQDWRYAPYGYVGFGKAVSAFDHARRGAHVAIPEDPPGWRMTLVKK